MDKSDESQQIIVFESVKDALVQIDILQLYIEHLAEQLGPAERWTKLTREDARMRFLVVTVNSLINMDSRLDNIFATGVRALLGPDADPDAFRKKLRER